MITPNQRKAWVAKHSTERTPEHIQIAMEAALTDLSHTADQIQKAAAGIQHTLERVNAYLKADQERMAHELLPASVPNDLGELQQAGPMYDVLIATFAREKETLKLMAELALKG